jgi:hypothetical protein
MTRLFIGFVSGLTPLEIVETFGAKARVTLTTAIAVVVGGGSMKTFSGISTAENYEARQATSGNEQTTGAKTRQNAVAVPSLLTR